MVTRNSSSDMHCIGCRCHDSAGLRFRCTGCNRWKQRKVIPREMRELCCGCRDEVNGWRIRAALEIDE